MTLEGNPWFVARDTCEALEMNLVGGTNPWLKHLAGEEKRPIPKGLIFGKGMSQATVISESGLYKLIMRSDKPQAKPFQDWVTKEVLPAIRKDGGYIMGEEKVRTRLAEPFLFAICTHRTSYSGCGALLVK